MEAAAVTERQTTGMAERLHAFLRTLPVEACVRILDALERAKLTGEAMPGVDMVIAELVAVIGTHRQPPRVGSPRRYLFAVLDPFLIDEELPQKCPARIARASLGHIWDWLQRDVAPAEIAEYETAVTEALLLRDAEKARSLTADLHKLLLPRLRSVLADRKGDDVAMRRLAGQLGGLEVFDDLRDLITVLEHREVLKALADKIGGPIRQVDSAQVAQLVGLLAPFARGRAAVMPYAAAVVMWRLTQPWQILRIASSAAESREALRVGSSPFSVIIDLVLCEMERLVIRAGDALDQNRAERATATVGDFASHVRALTTDFEIGPELSWAKRLGAIRSAMAQVVQPAIDDLHGQVRRLLRLNPGHAEGTRLTFDTQELAAAELALDFFVVVKNHAAELALSEVTLRLSSDLHGFLEASVTPLLDGLRAASSADRPYRLQQLDAAVRIARRILGSSYAGLLSKAVEVAAAERKPITRAG